MPNCDFYAVKEDFEQIVLPFLFNKMECRVFENYSEFEKELVEFKSVQDLKNGHAVGECKKKQHSVCLQLWPVKASSKVSFKKINLDPRRCKGKKYRYAIEGWGLIQLYLGGLSELGIVASRTNHNSEKRANAWSRQYPELGKPGDWNWKEVTKVSNELNKHIRKCAVSKMKGRPVLPTAFGCTERGIQLL